MQEFANKNDHIDEAMETHLISLADENGVFSNDYEAFFKYRMTRFHEELKKRVLLAELNKS